MKRIHLILIAILVVCELLHPIFAKSSGGGGRSSGGSRSSYRSSSRTSGGGGSCDGLCGMILGIVFGVIFGVPILIILVIVCIRKSRMNRSLSPKANERMQQDLRSLPPPSEMVGNSFMRCESLSSGMIKMKKIGCVNASAQANYPCRGHSYMEITLADNDGMHAIGLASKNYPAHRLPGWEPVSMMNPEQTVGYHSDDGCLYRNQANSRRNLGGAWNSYRTVIGMGYDADNGQVYVTKNGQLLGTAFEGWFGEYYWTVGMDSDQAEVHVNLGGAPFQYQSKFIDPTCIAQPTSGGRRNENSYPDVPVYNASPEPAVVTPVAMSGADYEARLLAQDHYGANNNPSELIVEVDLR